MIQVRPTTYRRQEGYLICGRDSAARKVRIFTTTRASANHIAQKLRRNETIIPEDFHPTQTESAQR